MREKNTPFIKVINSNNNNNNNNNGLVFSYLTLSEVSILPLSRCCHGGLIQQIA